jgi:hypothetical protein
MSLVRSREGNAFSDPIVIRTTGACWHMGIFWKAGFTQIKGWRIPVEWFGARSHRAV